MPREAHGTSMPVMLVIQTCIRRRVVRCTCAPSQVLDLCIWQREFRTGLAGTGRDVGAGSMHADDDVLHQRPPTESAEIAGTHGLPPAPVGCRYMRVHRLADVDGQVTTTCTDCIQFTAIFSHPLEIFPSAEIVCGFPSEETTVFCMRSVL